MKKNKFKLIIFDFDGTIADTFGIFAEYVNEFLEKRGRNPVTKKEIERVKSLSAKEVFKYFEIPNYQLPFVLGRVFLKMGKRFNEISVFGGVEETLIALNKKSLPLVILTSNIKRNVEKFISNRELKSFFDLIYYKVGIFSKDIAIKKIAEKYKIKTSQILLVGDEVRDVEAARNSGAKIVAVTWGYNSKRVLKYNKPDYLVNNPEDLLKIIKP